MKTQLTVTTAFAALMIGMSAPAFAASHETPAENAAENAGQAMENAGEAVENAAEGAAQATENAAEQAGEAMENAAENAGETMTAVVFMPYDATTQVTSDEIVGMKVEGTGGERVGDVNQVVLSTEGEALGIVVGVGGFLGIGEKDVAVSFDRVEFAQDEGMAERKIVLNATAEELEAAPAYERTN